jgi:hypothetical protein
MIGTLWTGVHRCAGKLYVCPCQIPFDWMCVHLVPKYRARKRIRSRNDSRKKKKEEEEHIAGCFAPERDPDAIESLFSANHNTQHNKHKQT